MDGSHWIDFNSPDYIFKDGSSNHGTPSPGNHHHAADQNTLQQSINQENINQQVILNESQTASSSLNPNHHSDQATEYYLQNLQKWTTLDLTSDNIISSPSNNQNTLNGDSRDPVNNMVINGNTLHNNDNNDNVPKPSTSDVPFNQPDQNSLTSNQNNNENIQDQYNHNNNMKPPKFTHPNMPNSGVQNSFPKYLKNVQNTNTDVIDSSHSSKYFTPLISPAMTPLESIMHPTPNTSSHDPFTTSDLTQGFFTPLTSPAINPVSNNPSPGSFFTINDFGMANAVATTMNGATGPASSTSSNRHKKSISSSTANSRRTSKNYSGRILKQTVTTTSKNSRNNSPVIKAEMAQRHQNLAADTLAKDSSLFMENNNKNNSYSIDLNDLADFALPVNAQANEYLFINSERKLYGESSSPLNNSSTSLHSVTNTPTGLSESSQVKDTLITDSTISDADNQQQQHPVTPATLMNLKNKSKQSVKRKKSSSSISSNSSSRTSGLGKDKLPIREITFQTTPITAVSNKTATTSSIKDSPTTTTSQTESQKQSQPMLQKTVAFSSFKTYKSKAAAAGTGNKKSIMDSVIAHQSQFKLNLPPMNNSSKNDVKNNYKMTADNDKNSKKLKEGTAKKSSHREAEKGRRDRMNIAIHDLALLLPEYLTSTVAVPSKATTVELASMYIKSLNDQLEAAKNENRELKQKYNIQ